MNWKFFFGATILSCGLLFRMGAPVLPVAAGVAAAAFLNWSTHRRSS
jgi:hypothetical protein